MVQNKLLLLILVTFLSGTYSCAKPASSELRLSRVDYTPLVELQHIEKMHVTVTVGWRRIIDEEITAGEPFSRSAMYCSAAPSDPARPSWSHVQLEYWRRGELVPRQYAKLVEHPIELHRLLIEAEDSVKELAPQ